MPLPDPVSKVSRTLARDEAYSKLRGWIIDGTLKPEENLNDHEIGAVLGVSRTPVREALRRLEDEGLVVTALNRWTRVAPLDLTRTVESYPIIESLEILALEQSFPMLTPEDLKGLEEINRAMRKAAKDRQAAAAAVADEEFHELWILRTGNSELLSVLRRLKLRLRRVELAYFDAAPRVDASFREHTAIIEALRKSSLPLACQALRNNWAGSLGRIRMLAENQEQR
ncbi:GntR family transcriptional regulator [Singulisphaera rosea]